MVIGAGRGPEIDQSSLVVFMHANCLLKCLSETGLVLDFSGEYLVGW